MKFLLSIGLWLLIALAANQNAMALVPVPALTGHVVDLTQSLSASEIQSLEQGLNDFEAQKGSQVAVLIVPTTAPEAIEQYSIRVVDEWKLGRKKEDDGVLLLVAKDDRALRIEVGYGLEGALSDLVSKRIISEIITPRLKAGDFSGGINAGVGAIVQVIQGEALPPPKAGQGSYGQGARGSTGQGGLGGGILMAAIIASLALRSIFGRIFGGALAGGLVGLVGTFLLGSLFLGLGLGVMALIFVLISGSMGGMANGLNRGGRGGWGGGGGFGGGGFGGGGGGFGGGGASGRW